MSDARIEIEPWLDSKNVPYFRILVVEGSLAITIGQRTDIVFAGNTYTFPAEITVVS